MGSVFTKYCKGTHPLLTTIPYYASTAWKRLKHIDQQAETYIAWHLGHGQIFFWHDCWMGESTLADQHPHLTHSSIQVRELFDDTGWIISRFLQLVPYIIAEQIGNIPITAEVHDQIMWKDTSDGRFDTKSAWQLVRTGHSIQAVYGELGVIWLLVVIVVRLLRLFSTYPSANGRFSVSLSILAFLGNDAKYQDISMEPKRIIWKVYHTISLLHTGRLFRVIHWCGDMDITPLFGISLTTPSLAPPVLVYWRTPSGGSYKRLVLLDLWIESDSSLAIHCITRGGGPWSIQATLRRIRHLLTFDRDTISHIYREENQMADLLVSEGWDRRCYFEYSAKDLPRRYHSLVHIDRHGISTVRGL
ncbi:Uncharacterized protein Adt_32919 [Abeliophyllum distichum]|uniref:RNase H type-1 domain-containing protein n=1 Tax=Abeliophyllum distichum TaxID=126358 RepID=A0ABD1QUX1_9LAMI